MNSKWWWVLWIGLAVACKGTKTAPGELERMRPKTLLKEVSDRQVDYKTIRAKAKIEYETPEERTSFKGDLRMQKDSAIWMSIKPALGLEVARVLITPDSIKILDRINKQYVIEPYSYLERLYQAPLDFSVLQSLVSGGLIYTDHKELEVDIVDNQYSLVYESDSIRNNVRINPVNFTVARLLIEDLRYQRQVQIDYSDYSLVEERLFSHQRLVEAQAEAAYRLELDFSRVSFDRELTYTFVVSDNYERIE